MGHKINPLVFRLGIKNNWQFNLKEKNNVIKNFMIYQLILNHFFKYTIPHFNKEYQRNQRHETGLVKMKGEKQLRINNFIKRSMLFSHMLLGSLNGQIKISCFLFDYKLLNRRKVKAKKFIRYNQLYANSLLKWKAYRSFFVTNIKKHPRKISRFLIYMIPNAWLFNFKLNKIKKPIVTNKIMMLSKSLVRLSKKIEKFNFKQRMFFLNVFSNVITMLLPMLKKVKARTLYNRLLFVLVHIHIINLHNKVNSCFFFTELFRTRYFFFKSTTKAISQNLKAIVTNMRNVNMKYHAIKERNMTSSLLTNLILTKLGQYYRINSILYPLTGWIRRHKNVLGFRIIISGRLTRRERATHMIKSGKSMPLSSLKYKIDYTQDVKIMKFGMVGVKVYLFVRKKLRNSYYYFNFIV